MTDGELNDARREVLLVEYQKAQDSAEHHDRLVGSVTSLWLGSAVLMGFVLTALTSTDAHGRSVAADHKSVLVIVVILGVMLTSLVLLWAENAARRKELKYARCKAIERMLGMEQHTRVVTSRRWRRFQTWAYRGLLGIFVAAWITLLVDVVTL